MAHWDRLFFCKGQLFCWECDQTCEGRPSKGTDRNFICRLWWSVDPCDTVTLTDKSSSQSSPWSSRVFLPPAPRRNVGLHALLRPHDVGWVPWEVMWGCSSMFWTTDRKDTRWSCLKKVETRNMKQRVINNRLFSTSPSRHCILTKNTPSYDMKKGKSNEDRIRIWIEMYHCETWWRGFMWRAGSSSCPVLLKWIWREALTPGPTRVGQSCDTGSHLSLNKKNQKHKSSTKSPSSRL